MCYGYMKEDAAARKDTGTTQVNITREKGTPAMEPFATAKAAEDKALARFLAKIRRMVEAHEERRDEITSG